ncbi:MAG: hypothetical protein QOI10_863 [Solirubrobacterales bacterium]|jgi:hypothetical protein|nr:hypothetical protein [Solirubrobacterales bacterium]
MNARWKLTLGVAAVLVVALAASAMASKTFFTATKGKASIFLALKSGSKQKIVDFSWDGLKCGPDRFTAGLGDAIKVKNDGSFKSEQPVAGAAEGVEIAAKVKGQVGQHVAKVTGKLKLTGDCETKVNFTATESAG